MFKIKLYGFWTLNAIKKVIARRCCHIFKLSAYLIVQKSFVHLFRRIVLTDLFVTNLSYTFWNLLLIVE